MGKYIYESHLGGLYATEAMLDFDFLYCDQCGDYDRELGYFESRTKARKALWKLDFYSKEDIKEFLDKEFPRRDSDG